MSFEYAIFVTLQINVSEDSLKALAGVPPSFRVSECDSDDLARAVENAVYRYELIEVCTYCAVPTFSFKFSSSPTIAEINTLGGLIERAMAPVVKARWVYLNEDED